MTAISEARTVADANAAFKAIVAGAILGNDGIAWPMPQAAKDASEELRRWHVAEISRRDGTRPKEPGMERPRKVQAPRQALHEQLGRPNDDGTMTCTGPCGEVKPVKKFPTARGGIGRLSVCRGCRDAAIAERKAAG